MSARWSALGSAAACSGDMYAGVPIDVPTCVSVEPSFRGRARRADRLRDAEVGHRRGTAGEQDVVRLDVAVHDAALVRVRRAPSATSRRMPTASAIGSGPRASRRAQRLAFDERHRVVRQAAHLARGEHRHDVRMLESGGELDLALEALDVDAGAEFRSARP